MKKRFWSSWLFYKSLKNWVLLWLLTACACQNESSFSKKYIFLGHPYDWHDGTQVDPRLEQLHYEDFNQVWLGGDVCSRTIETPSTLNYLDSLYHFNSDKVHWTWGNHDILYGDPRQISLKTGKPSFYADWVDGFCLLVLNTNLFWPYPSRPAQENCDVKLAQMELMQKVTDTVKAASHLVVLHHHALFTELKPQAHTDLFNVNAVGMQMTCDSASFLTPWFYQKLKEVQQRGVQVLLIGGDFGMRAKSYAHQTPDGIWLIGSGINNSVDRRYVPDYVTNLDPDKVLILDRNVKTKSLSWTFADLDSLAAVHEKLDTKN